jgi:hypothetical protein
MRNGIRILAFGLGCVIIPTFSYAQIGHGGGGRSSAEVSEDAASSDQERLLRIGCRRTDTAASTAGTDGDWAALPCDANGRVPVANYNPNLAADNSTNSTSKVPTMPCVANATAPSWTEGRQVPCSTDLAGYQRTRTIDACSSAAKTFLPISINTATTTEITPSLAGASTYYYVCSLVLVTNATNIVTLVDDDSDGCGSPTSGLSGGTTTAGWTMAANGVLSFGNGTGSVFKTGGANRVICLVTSAATQLSGTMTVVTAP